MLTPRQSVFVKGSSGDPLPSPFKSLESKGTRFIRGQLCLVCAAPGVGKSAFVLAYAVRSKVPTFYFSADSDQSIQISRMLSIELGWTMERSSEVFRKELLQDELDHIPIRFSYESNPSLEDIKKSLEAYDEVYGDFPELIVVDNISNVVTDLNEEDPFSGLEVLMEQLHALARITGACVVGLHHVTGPHNDATSPVSLKGIKNQIGRVPEMVLTLHRVEQYGTDSLRVSTVKNRASRADPSGMNWTALDFDGDRMQITDPK